MITRRSFGPAAAALAGLLSLAGGVALAGPPPEPEAQATDLAKAKRPFAWDKEVLNAFATLAVQDGGRVKPLDTLAGFKLLKLNGKRSARTPEGESLTPIAWLLDCVFFPDAARRYQVFLVQNADALDAIGLSHETKGKRDRYSFADLAPGVQQLYQLADQYSRVPEAERNVAQTELTQLAHNVHEFEQLTGFLDFARHEYPTQATDGLKKLFPDAKDRDLAAIVEKAKPLIAHYQNVQKDPKLDAAGKDAEMAAVRNLVGEVEQYARNANALAPFPPAAKASEQPEWLSPADVFQVAFNSEEPVAANAKLLRVLAQLEKSKSDPAAFKTSALELHKGLEDLAAARGEYKKIPLEVFFYKCDFFYNALYLYLLAFLLVAFSWAWPSVKPLTLGSLAASGLGTALVIAGITLRCIIRSRPPVSTLYETILFITATAVLTCAVIEWVNRQGIAQAVAPVLGVAGMFLATKYEFKESVSSGDTMPSLVAVLDTNFWLATHVTAVTMGYAAGLLATAISHVWLVGKILGLKPGDDAFYKNVARISYGVLCFGLLFSVAGTILGGIWANYSWGRFWGWDPKENGALLICLWELIIIHARLGGYVRDFGLAVLSVVNGVVIAFSWWGVNLLGVGLHSYGFTSGVFQVLVAFYALEGLVVLLALGWRMAQSGPAPAVPAAPTPSPAAAPAAPELATASGLPTAAPPAPAAPPAQAVPPAPPTT